MIKTKKLLKKCGYNKATIDCHSNKISLISDGKAYEIIDLDDDNHDDDNDFSDDNYNFDDIEANVTEEDKDDQETDENMGEERPPQRLQRQKRPRRQ
jgi:hypothetical protein